MTRPRGIVLAIALIVACLIVLGVTSEFLVDWIWFSSVGFLGVFWTIIGAKSALFAAVFAATAIVVWVNGALAFRFARARLSAPGQHAVGIVRQRGIACGDRTLFTAPALAPSRQGNFCRRRDARRTRLGC
jgi:uncharacterized membrane protein (UPF0182 family)